ncbi:MAG: type II toxin-antitoxin system RelE/ParE family toxin [Synechocystis sp.]
MEFYSAKSLDFCFSRDSRRVPSEIIQKTLNKLDILNAIEKLDKLKSPLGNPLETLEEKVVFTWMS